jgi:hypothetical protein
MEEENIRLIIKIDTSMGEYKPDYVYGKAEELLKESPVLFDAMVSGKIKVGQPSSFVIDPTMIATLSFVVSFSGVAYNLVRNIIKDRKEYKRLLEAKELSQKQLEALEEIVGKLSAIQKSLGQMGLVKIDIDENTGE